MADINVVIKISEEDYATIMSDKTHQPRSLTNLEWKIANGIPLPKGHGRLIDADALIDTLGCSDRDIYVKACIEEDAPTIVEADKG